MKLFRSARILVVLMLVASACTGSGDTTITATTAGPTVAVSAAESPTPPISASVSSTAEPLVALRGFDSGTVSGDVGPLPVLLAQTSDQRRQGLMGVEDLQGWGGMWFEFSEVGSRGFWMKDTLLPLSIVWIDVSGIVVAVADMEPCLGDPCPRYVPGVEHISALEVEQGQLSELGIELGSYLVFGR